MEFSPASFTAAHWFFFTAVIFFAFLVRGFTGFGSSALCVALLTFIMPPALVVPLIFMIEIIASISLIPGSWRQVDIKWLLPTTVGIIIGMPLGVWLLAQLTATAAQLFVYGLLAFFAAAHLLRARGVIPVWTPPPLLVGIVAGVANGLAAIAGMVVALFLLASARPAATVRASLIALFFATDIYGLAWGGGLGLLQAAHGVLLPPALVPMLAGVFIGGRLFSKSGGRNYRPLAIALVLGATAVGLIKLLVAQVW